MRPFNGIETGNPRDRPGWPHRCRFRYTARRMDPLNPSVTFTLTREEYLTYVRDCMRNGWAFSGFVVRSRRQLRNTLLIAVAACLLALGLYGVSRAYSPRPSSVPLIFGIMSGAWAVILLRRWQQGTSHQLTIAFERLIDSGEIRVSKGEQSVTLLPEGVLARDPTTTLLIQWLFGIERVVQSDTSLLLFTAPSEAFVVPNRAFPDAASCAAFAARAMELFEARGRTGKLRLIDFLEGRDAPCPRCNYNLRDAQSDRCPECGEPVTVEAIVRAAALRKPDG